MALSLSPEFSLVAACSIWPPSESRTNTICNVAEQHLDWDRILYLAKRHHIAGLVQDGLARAQLAVPSGVSAEIDAQATALACHNLALAAEALKLHCLFARANLPVAFVKGVSLAQLAYGNLGIRHGRDLDILVSPHSVMAATKILRAAGYRLYEPPAAFNEAKLQTWLLRCKELRFVHKQHGYQIELHARLFDNSRLMDAAALMNSLRMVEFAEGVRLPTFGAEDLFSYLCTHGAVHCWFRLKWLADIGAILARQPCGGVERLYRTAEIRGLGRCAAQAILLCKRLFGMALPDELIAKLTRDGSVRRLERMALSAITADLVPTEQLFGTTWNNFSLFLLRPEGRYWLAELEDHLISPVDILTLPLPPQLRGLYPVLRLPLWFWRHRKRRAKITS
jgi:Uncharacterised nucleotidyltransferase